MSQPKDQATFHKQHQAIEINLNPNIQPIYGDQILQVAMESNVIKLLIGHRVNNVSTHTATVVLPTTALLTLNTTLNNIFSNVAFQKKIIEDTEISIKALQERFDQLSK